MHRGVAKTLTPSSWIWASASGGTTSAAPASTAANIVDGATDLLHGGAQDVLDEEEFNASPTSPVTSDLPPPFVNQFPYNDDRVGSQGNCRLRREKARKNSKRSARHAYPTPERSPASSEGVLTPSPSSSVCDLTVVEESPSRKRRGSEVEEESRPVKRTRIENNTTPPSPAPSLREATPPTSEEAPCTSTTPTPAPSTLNKRKRRLSDGFQYPAAKRPQLRQQAVSDPFPATSATPTPTFNIDEWDQWLWFAQFATSEPPMPESVSVEAPDCTTPLDIELSSLPSYAMCSGSTESSPEHLPLSISSDYIPSAVLESFCEVETEPSSSTSAAEYPLELPAYTYQEYLDATSLSLHLQPLEVLPIATAAPTVNNPSHSHSPITATATDLTSITIPTFDVAHTSFDLDVFLENLSGELGPLDHGSALELDMERFLAGGALSHPVAGAVNDNTTTTAAASGSLMSPQEREAKRRELEELEARARAIRAEICDA